MHRCKSCGRYVPYTELEDLPGGWRGDNCKSCAEN